MANINTIIFDLGGVLIDWNPDYVYDTIFDKPEEKNGFMKTSAPVTGMKNRMQDGH